MTKRAILVSLLLAVCAGAVTAAPLLDGDADSGKQKSAACAACHGADGNSTSAEFPKLAGQNPNYIFEQLQLFKSGKRENAIMSAQASALSKQDMKDVAVYFGSQKIKPAVVSDMKLAQAGARIFHGGLPDFKVPACSGCHGPSGMGNPAAAYPRISGQQAKYVVEQLHAYRKGERSGTDKAQIMEGVTRGLSDHDIDALAAYVASLMPAKQGQENTSGALLQHPPKKSDEAKKDDDDASKDSDKG